MIAIILAAGYATRLYPLTIDKPKALLPVADKPILDYIITEIETIEEISKIVVISNNKFYKNFIDWKNKRINKIETIILNDNTMDDETKLGAIGDLQFAIDTLNLKNEDLLIIAGDNLFTFKLKDFYNEYKIKNSDMILVKEINEIEELRRMANVIVDTNMKVINMEEKPQNPKSNIAAFASYIYKKETVPLIKEYLSEGNNPDAPGFFPSWLYQKKDVHAYKFKGECYDIGTPTSYKQVNEIFKR